LRLMVHRVLHTFERLVLPTVLCMLGILAHNQCNAENLLPGSVPSAARPAESSAQGAPVLTQEQMQALQRTPQNLPAHEDYPPSFTDNINAIPDLLQSDERAGFPNRGLHICSLVAASNSLMWLGNNGYPNLVEHSGDAFQDQVKLIRTLGLPAYTRARPAVGTTFAQLIRGVRAYVKERGYAIRRLECQGWYSPKADANQPMPQLDWLKRGMLHNGAVWLSLGFYRFDDTANVYRYQGGHAVTLVGYRPDASGSPGETVLIIHDPSPTAGDSFSNDSVTARRLTSGTVFSARSRGRPASTCYQLVGVKTSKAAPVAILEEAITLQLQPPNSAK
jgi:hypothetical protein